MTTRAGDRPVADDGVPSAGQAEPASERDAAVPVQPRALAWRWFFLVWLAALVVLLANDPGRMVFDTKLGVDLDPAGYLAGLWHLWDPQDTFGAINNQAIGYAVPMAPFYLVGQLVHAPVWLTERLWMSLIIATGFTGLVKLASALGIGSPASRLWAGLLFALWPTFTILIGSTSAAVLPGMLAPWAVVPLVSATRTPGPGPSRLRSWRGLAGPAARSAVAVLCMGGVNATSTIDALLLPGLFILTHARGRRLVSLAVCWGAAVAAATAWWSLPLLLQGKYAFNFLPYIEQAGTTTATASAATVLRGAGNWVAYFNLGTPWLSAGWDLVTTPFAIAAAAFAAAFGLYGLSLRSMPEAAWLRLSAGVAAAGALAGYGGQLSGPFHQTVDQLLNGTLAPFRNVYKLEPVIAAALALGLAHATANWLRRATGEQTTRRAVTQVARLGVAVVVIGLALPFLSDQVLNPGSFSAVPRYWDQVAEFLAAASPRNPALVVPADAHGEYLWGDPIDDPLEALGRSPWVERGLVPYGGAGSQILLDTAEQAFESGEQVNGLAAYLARAGIRYVVVRNDLDPGQIGYTSPAIVHQTLALSGFTRVAAFGPLITGAQTAPGAAPQVQAALPAYPAVEIFAAATTGSGPALSPVTTLPVSQTVLVNGGPDSLLQLAGQNLLGPGQPAIMAGDPMPTSPARWAVTDGQRRADTSFGLVNSDVSYTYTANETNPVDDQLGGAGGPPRQLLPVPAAGHQTVAVLSGAAQVTASSYGFWLADTQQEDPANAFDGDPATAWTEGSPQTPVGQWIQITFDEPMDMPASIGIRLLDDSPEREMADRVRVSTAAGGSTTELATTDAVQPLNVAPGLTRWLRVTITGARGVVPGGLGAGISDVLIPGVQVTRLLQPAEDPPGRQAASVIFSFHQQVPSPVTLGNPEAVPPMARTFILASPMNLHLGASALAVPGTGLDALLDKAVPPGRRVLQVSVASSPGSLSTQSVASLLRGSGRAPWIAGTAVPVIQLSWHGKRRIGSLVVQPVYNGVSVPETVEVTSPNGTREAAIGSGGLVVFSRPLTTDRIDVSFPNVQQVTAVSPTGQVSTLPVGLSELSVPALADLRVAAPNERARLSLACGQGPVLFVDGQAYQTAVSGTIGELSQYLPVQVRLCTPGGTLTLGAGQHTLTVAAPGTFAVTDLSLTSAGTASATTPGSRTVAIGSWQPDQRRLTIGPGPASYLEIHQNYNTGWVATLNGRMLTPVRLDGWQQGYVVPAGAGGTIALTFRPTAAYHLCLAASLLAIIVLLALAVWPVRMRFLTRFRPGTGSGQVASSAWPPSASPAGPGHASRRARWLGAVGVLVLIFVAGGPVVLAVPVLAYLAWRRPYWLPALALTGMTASGLLVTAAAQPTGGGLGAFGAPAQACALVGLAAALMPTITLRTGIGRHPGSPAIGTATPEDP